jgi:hypothetical protein
MKICDLCGRPSITPPVYAAVQQPNECWRDARMDTPYYELDCLRLAVKRMQAALQVNIRDIADALLRGVDRLAQAQQIVVSSLESAVDIIKMAGK